MSNESDLNRRDFGKLTLAVLAGVCSGVGRSLAADTKPKSPLLGDKHVCRGINTCRGKGADKKNSCVGMGQCATAKQHSCGGQNECKGQGGCGEHPGENACKGQGSCAVPMEHHDAWKKARARFEALMTAEKKKFGKAPPPPKKG